MEPNELEIAFSNGIIQHAGQPEHIRKEDG
jgi:hypothetical protein